MHQLNKATSIFALLAQPLSRMRRFGLCKLAILCFICMPMLSFALPTDQHKPATISADSAVLNRNTGISNFTGHVKIIQGTTEITANKLVTYSNKKHKLVKAVATGHPATYQTMPKLHQKLFHASAKTILYFPITGRVELIGAGKLTQGNNVFTGQHIIYNQKTGLLKSLAEKNSRTEITLEPTPLKNPNSH